MNIVHLTASTFFGGPERQMLGLASALPETYRTAFLSFAEGKRSRPFLAAARRRGFEAAALAYDTPHLRKAVAELAAHLEGWRADVLCCHGYKANLLGRLAARRRSVPVVAVSRGWTGESLKVRLYEAIDRLHLRWMDRVVCVSEAQAARVRPGGVRPDRLRVIRNAVDPERFYDPEPHFRTKLLRCFKQPPARVVGAAGRLSPEKGFGVLVAAAERVWKREPSAGFVLFGDGPCRARLQRQIQAAGLAGTFVLGGFRADLDRLLPHLDLLALPSFTEGLPNVVLEAFAAGVPVVASAVGGVPEVVEDGANGYLVRAGDADALADRICRAFESEDRLRDMGLNGRQRVHDDFTFAAQARQYQRLFEELKSGPARPPVPRPPEAKAPAGAAEAAATRDDELVPAGPPCRR
jgi:glycosyltransferase involved in cell wall biosynthesis